MQLRFCFFTHGDLRPFCVGHHTTKTGKKEQFLYIVASDVPTNTGPDFSLWSHWFLALLQLMVNPKQPYVYEFDLDVSPPGNLSSVDSGKIFHDPLLKPTRDPVSRQNRPWEVPNEKAFLENDCWTWKTPVRLWIQEKTSIKSTKQGHPPFCWHRHENNATFYHSGSVFSIFVGCAWDKKGSARKTLI